MRKNLEQKSFFFRFFSTVEKKSAGPAPCRADVGTIGPAPRHSHTHARAGDRDRAEERERERKKTEKKMIMMIFSVFFFLSLSFSRSRWPRTGAGGTRARAFAARTHEPRLADERASENERGKNKGKSRKK
jgi:hypothetical protein